MAKKVKKRKKRKKPKKVVKGKVREKIGKKIKKAKAKEQIHRTKIKVIGIGGGGSSIVSEISRGFAKNIDFVVANTDLQALKQAGRKIKRFQFGQELTHGLGCGMNPELGKEAALKAEEKIKKLFEGVDFSILISTLGGGTGSGALPVFAEISRKTKNITLGIFTLPFKFEGEKKAEISALAIEKTRPNLNAQIIFPNENIFKVIDKNTSLSRAFSEINQRLAESLRGLLETIFGYGLINIDFADLKTIFAGRGKLAFLNWAEAQGPNRAEEAIRKILQNPLAKYNITSQGQQKKTFFAERILFNIFSSKNLKMSEVEKISKAISDANPKAKIIFGISNLPPKEDKIRITLLSIGRHLKAKPKAKKRPPVLPPKPSGQLLPETKIKKPEEKAKPISKAPPKKIQKKTKKPIKIKAAPLSESSPLGRTQAGRQKPKGLSQKILERRNALELKKEIEKIEKEMLAEEKKWETPAFLRRKVK